MNQAQIALGFDYGLARIGLAIGNRHTGLSRALGWAECPRSEVQWQALAKTIDSWNPDVLVVGKPLALDGSVQAITLAAQQFADALQQRFGLPVSQVDERLSSVAAAAELTAARRSGDKARRNRRGDDDSLAAAILVQQWLDET